MYNFTINTYEMKREIINFSQKIAKGVNKSTSKFIMDMEYGISKSGSCLISEISRSLNESIKLQNTIERLCDNLVNLNDDEINIIKNNYFNEVKDLFPEEPIAIFDDSDIAKRYGKKFENLDEDMRPPSGFNTTYKRIVWDEPCSTISTNFSMISGCRNVHPTSTRSLTIREAARAQSFPDEFVFSGKWGDIRKAIGNAVPPILAAAIAKSIFSQFFED